MNRVVLAAASRAEDAGFAALIDLANVVGSTTYRIIGGYMVQLHVARWQLGAELYRLTGDADLGVPPVAVQGPELVNALTDLKYEREAGNRFRRRVSDAGDTAESDAVIDVLVATYQTRVRQNRKFGDHLTTTEVPGLAFALRRDPVVMSLELRRLSSEVHAINLLIPDEVSALVLKSYATTVREKSTDFSDLWRCLEICFAAGLGPTDFAGHGDSETAAERVRRLFAAPDALGMRMLVADQKLSDVAAGQRFARVSALVDRVLG